MIGLFTLEVRNVGCGNKRRLFVVDDRIHLHIQEEQLDESMRKLGIAVAQQHQLPVYYEDGTLLGDFKADLFVEGKVIVELKSAKSLTDAHTAQMLGYHRAARIEHGILINFGAPCLQFATTAGPPGIHAKFCAFCVFLWLECASSRNFAAGVSLILRLFVAKMYL